MLACYTGYGNHNALRLFYILAGQYVQNHSGKRMARVYICTIFTNAHGLVKATPVVIADSELEGIEEGIYELYRDDAFGRKADADFTNMCMAIPSVLWSENI